MPAFLKLNEKCAFYPYEGSSSAEEFLLLTPGGRQFVLSSFAKEILQNLDGKTTLETIAQRLQSQQNIPISGEQLQSFLEEQYGALGIFEGYIHSGPASATSQRRKRNPIPVFLHWRLIPAWLVLRVAKVFSALFNRFDVLAGILAIAVSHYWLYRHKLPDLLDDSPNLNLLIVTLLALFSVLVHEFGHASAVTRYGGTPGPIGFGLYALMPSFYADVSEIWRFSRRQRMAVDWAGVYFQQLIFVIFVVLSYLTAVPEFAVACTVVDTMVLLNLNPVFQFDGYWFLVDYLGLPDLHRLAWGQLKKWIFRSKNVPALPLMRRHAYWAFLVYVGGVAGFVALLLGMEYRYLLLPTARFLAALPKMLNMLNGDFRARKFLELGNHLLLLFSFFAVSLSAVMGLGMYGIRIYRYLFRRTRAVTQRAA